MDGDLQNDPNDIPKLIEAIADVDLVSGWRKNRQDTFISRKLPSKIANWLISRVTGVRLHDYGCSLKAYRRDVVKTSGSMEKCIVSFLPLRAGTAFVSRD